MIAYYITDAAGVVVGEGMALTKADAERDGSPYGQVHIASDGDKPTIHGHVLRRGKLKAIPARSNSFEEWTGRAWKDTRTADERLAETRVRRDRLLAESDWTQLPDADLTDEQRAAWRDYRQALRDVTDTGRWPDKPE